MRTGNMPKLTQPLKWHGGKHYLAPKIIALMPKHLHYVEPYFGGGSVLLAKDHEGVSEVANDLHVDLTRFWKVLQGGNSFKAFERLCQATPFSEAEWDDAKLEMIEWPVPDEEVSDNVVRAWKWFIYARQSMSGRMKCFSPITKRRVRRGMNEQASAWLTTVEGLPAVHNRLKRVVILNHAAVDAIQQQDEKDTLFYCDPPYLHETRNGHTPADYLHEMTTKQHRELLSVLADIKGKFLLSGYPSPLYDSFETCCKWKCHTFDLPNNAAWGNDKRRMVECLWSNY